MSKRSKRIWVVLRIGLCLAAGAWASLYFCLARPEGGGPAGPLVNRASFSRAWTERPVLVVGLGDSVTAGFGARKGYSYFDRLLKNPADEFPEMQDAYLASVFPKMRATNLAMSGSTSSEVADRQLAALATNAPEVLGIVVITTGGNDLIHNYGHTPPREEAMFGATLEEARPWITNLSTRLQTTAARIESRFPGGCEIFLANIFDPTDGIGDANRAGLPAWNESEQILAAYNAAIAHLAETDSRVHIVNIHDPFLGHGIHCLQFWNEHFDRHDPHYWYYFNLEDPNERGYDAIRRLFLNEIVKMRGRIK